MSVSVIIPARNEVYLEKTIKSILAAARNEIEIIAILDGYLPDPTIVIDDDRVTFLHFAEPIGQRAAINAGAKAASGKYVLKTDAHSMFDEGFDIKLAADCEYDWTVIPRMYNLDVNAWLPKWHKRTDFMWIRSPYAKHKPFRHNYWDGTCQREFPAETIAHKEWAKKQPEIADVMTGQGACFFMHRDRFWELGGCDEGHGSWGQQGVEVALKAWLSGGALKVNKKTWFSHWFRGGGGPGFPYQIHGSDQEKARKYSIEFWQNPPAPFNKRDLEWLVKKFAPLPTWNGYAAKPARPTLRKVLSSTKWINKGHVFDVAELHRDRLKYANPKKLEGIKWLNECFPVIVKAILAGDEFDDERRAKFDYYKYLVSRLNSAVVLNGTPNAKGRRHCLNKIKDLERLCASIKREGLRSPLDMYMDSEHPVLTRGGRRLEIIYQLGWKTVPVRIWRNEWLARRFIGSNTWNPVDDSIHGCAVKQFVKYKERATDKYWVHNYTPYYDFYMRAVQHRHIKILELGVKTGASLALWHDAFPKATIYGIDKDASPQHKPWIDRKRVHVETFDLYKSSSLEDFAKQHGPFDMIVDDAIHTPQAQWHCFKTLWPHLKENGVFAIEDLHPNFKAKYKLNIIPELAKRAQNIWTDQSVQSVSFYPNICFLRKA